jgi:hypothetical protein
MQLNKPSLADYLTPTVYREDSQAMHAAYQRILPQPPDYDLSKKAF